MGEKVILALYDITNGMAKSMSMMFIGQQVDAVQHSSLIVYGREYYFGGGIVNDPPRQTPFGKPIEEIDMGETEIPKEVFEEYLASLGPKYTAEKYHIIDHNCNNFTDEACEFLTGQPIPKRVLDQAKDLLNTPAGQMFKPILMQMQGTIQSPPPGMFN